MDEDIRRYIISVMKDGTGGCKHLEMTQALNCERCKDRMVKAQSEFNRLIQSYPEKFIRKKTDDGFDLKTQNLGQRLEDRKINDRLYRKHLELIAHGTPEEKLKELKLEMSGFYERHTGDHLRRTL